MNILIQIEQNFINLLVKIKLPFFRKKLNGSEKKNLPAINIKSG